MIQIRSWLLQRADAYRTRGWHRAEIVLLGLHAQGLNVGKPRCQTLHYLLVDPKIHLLQSFNQGKSVRVASIEG